MLSLWILDPLVSTEVKWKKLQIWDQVEHLYGQILQKQQNYIWKVLGIYGLSFSTLYTNLFKKKIAYLRVVEGPFMYWRWEM